MGTIGLLLGVIHSFPSIWPLTAPYKNIFFSFGGKDGKISITQEFKIILGWEHKLEIQQLSLLSESP